MTIQPPNTPGPAPGNLAVHPAPAADPGAGAAGGTAARDPFWDLAALLAFLAVTALLYLLIGPGAGMVTGIATGLFTTYHHTTSTPDTPSTPPPPGQEPQRTPPPPGPYH